MDETYEFDLDLNVTKTLQIRGKNEDEAIGILYDKLEAKGISREQISQLKWRVVPLLEPKPN